MDAYESTSVLPPEPGVYRFRDGRGRALYVGRASNLRTRVRSYWRDVGDRPHLRQMVARIDRVEVLACQSRHEAAWLERNVLEHRMPPWNRTPGGQEVPVWLQLTAHGLAVAYRRAGTARYFGPYLGGTRVRQAVTGLHRIYPLRYASARLTPAERELARVRGLLGADLAGLQGTVAAVLERDPAAVAAARDALLATRHAAAGDQAYERAASIQRELEALAWITEPQQVTVEGGDIDAYGWHDGTLVRLEIRSGRLRDWQVSAAGAGPGERRVAGTPAAWQAFTGRNARLAAAIRSSRGSSPPVPGSTRRHS